MRGSRLAAAVLTAWAVSAAAVPAAAQGPIPNPDRIAAQTEAMKPLAWMDGVWRGTAWFATPEGRRQLIHTERVGPMIAGSLKVIEGKSYTGAGLTEAGFNAFAVISHDPQGGYVMRSYAQGRAGDFPMTLTPDGWNWSAGPVKYQTTHKDGVWTERGDYTPPGGGPSRQVFSMEMRRIGPTSWPADGAVPAR